MRCPIDGADLGKQETITSFKGVLVCDECAKNYYDPQELQMYGEQVVPSDIGVYQECAWCNEEFEEGLVETDLGLLCTKCSGEEVKEW